MPFLEVRDFEDYIRNDVSLGGRDTHIRTSARYSRSILWNSSAVVLLIAERRGGLTRAMTDVLDEFDRVSWQE